MNEKAQQNKFGISGMTAIDIVLILAYLIEVVKGSKTIGYIAFMAVFGILPVVIGWIVYSREPESDAEKYVIGIGYAVFYGVMLFSTDSALTFVYSIPIIIIIGIFNNLKYAFIQSAVFFVLNIAQVIYVLTNNPGDKVKIANAEIQIAVMLLTCIFSILVTKMNAKFNDEKIEAVEEKEEQSEELLERILSVSSRMTECINEVTEKMSDLGESVKDTQTSMEEVNEGNSDAAESIQNQMEKTEEIQAYIDQVTGSSDEIRLSMEEAEEAISLGNNIMQQLIKQVQESEKSSGNAVSELNELNEYTAQMSGIVDLINSVASQTSLLALNASIEAARAGEAGRGFAVVATEISNLAGQTQKATENITSLISNIDGKLKEVIEAINVLLRANEQQNKSAAETAEDFNLIETKAAIATKDAKTLSELVKKLAASNREIVESIQTISAVTEEISAHSNQTLESSRHDGEIVDTVTTLVQQLNEDAAVLQVNE